MHYDALDTTQSDTIGNQVFPDKETHRKTRNKLVIIGNKDLYLTVC